MGFGLKAGTLKLSNLSNIFKENKYAMDAIQLNPDVEGTLAYKMEKYSIPPNRILAMPTKPTYNNLDVTVYAGTKVSIPNGRNADGTIRNIILTLATDVTHTLNPNGRFDLLLISDQRLSKHWGSDVIYIDKLSERPETLPTTASYFCYCAETNLIYTTSGSLTASWSVRYLMILGIATTTSIVTDLYVNDVYNVGQEIEKINTSLTRRKVAHSFTIASNSYASYTFTSSELFGLAFAIIGIQTLGADLVATECYALPDGTIYIVLKNLTSSSITRTVTVFYLSA